MFKFLCRRAPKSARVDAKPRYVQARDFHTTAFHIRDTEDESGLALCGTQPLDDRGGLTLLDYRAMVPNQHAGWHFCRDCAPVFEEAQHG